MYDEKMGQGTPKGSTPNYGSSIKPPMGGMQDKKSMPPPPNDPDNDGDNDTNEPDAPNGDEPKKK